LKPAFFKNYCFVGGTFTLIKKFELIDFLKGYSIFTIIIYHLLQDVADSDLLVKAISFGGTGIHAFILLSGFSLYYSYLNKPVTYFQFLKRRFSKIYIPYVIIVVISALLSFWLPLFNNSWYSFMGHLFLYKMFDDSIIVTYGYHFWFISTIMQFYLIFFLLIWLKKIVSNGTFFGLGIVVSMLWISFVLITDKTSSLVLSRFMLQYFWEFTAGMVLAEMIYLQKSLPRLKNFWIVIIGLTGLALYAYLAIEFKMVGVLTNDIPGLIGYAAIAIFVYNLRIDVMNRFFLFTGEISYSLFLVHSFVVVITHYTHYEMSYYFWIVSLVMALPLTYLLGWGYYKIYNAILR